MSTQAAKRRRIDAASHVLAKPFRSPFKTPFKSPVKDTSTSTSSPDTTSATATNPSSILADKTPNTSLATPSLATPSRIRAPVPRSTKTFSSPVQAAALNADPDIAPLLRRQRELERELRDVKEGLDVAEQALKIEAESRKRNGELGVEGDGEVDGELVELIGRWTAASRQAAEELFVIYSDSFPFLYLLLLRWDAADVVSGRMGGPRAWKEMQKKQDEFQNTWDQPDEQMNNGNGAGGDSDDDEAEAEARAAAKKDLYAQYDVEEETENEKSQRPKGLGDTGERPGEEDVRILLALAMVVILTIWLQEFTMAMMLRTLNVDLDVIGYDREQQRWVD
ncbi:Swi5-dependent recombination DNA repair protein [Lachnellula occidentalis]|uniref:Swi5-dependent recombination DNA repair protein n=1 Tax=Lachnellula occidentalis TaxID=215460 RepID=A0A8H8UHQ0_9HELO|nr:Swi5-dependent recombination DNA repair protein [Lachnellula occidentalis]